MTDAYDIIVKYIQEYKTPRVFDVGCGTGILGMRMTMAGLCTRYKGLDRDPKAIATLTKHNGLQGLEGDLRWYDGRNFGWDTVVLKDVLEEMDSFALMEKAIIRARRMFILATTAPVYDSLMPKTGYSVDAILTLARSCSFTLSHFQQVGSHSIMVFNRKVKGRKR